MPGFFLESNAPDLYVVLSKTSLPLEPLKSRSYTASSSSSHCVHRNQWAVATGAVAFASPPPGLRPRSAFFTDFQNGTWPNPDSTIA